MNYRPIVLFLAGVLLAVVGLALSWRLLIELVGLVLLVAGLAMAVSAVIRWRG
ncbi:MAG: hypothetical protein QXS57_05780 [Candidatus Caldarchaeum sp.]